MSNILTARPTDVLLSGVVGSTAYGLDTETSDIDTLGVYRAALHDVLGLDAARHISNTWVETAPDPDLTLHEVGKYLSLALKNNPTIMELLWLPHHTARTVEGSLIVANRKHFLYEAGVRGAYGNYALQQAERLMRRRDEGKEGFDSSTKHRVAKHARHCIRLLLQGRELLSTGSMSVDVSEHRDILFGMGQLAEEDADAFYNEFEYLKSSFDQIDTVLPERPNREKIAELLPRIRMHGQ